MTNRFVPAIANVLNFIGIGWVIYQGVNGSIDLSWSGRDFWIALMFVGASTIPTTYHWFRVLNGVGREIVVSYLGKSEKSLDTLLTKPFFFMRWMGESIEKLLIPTKDVFILEDGLVALDAVLKALDRRIVLYSLVIVAGIYIVDYERLSDMRKFSIGPILQALWGVMALEIVASTAVIVLTWVSLRMSVVSKSTN